MALQIILSGAVGGLVVIKLFWGNFVNTILRRKPAIEGDEQEEADDESVETSTSYNVDSTTS
jgi:hypothetical protein